MKVIYCGYRGTYGAYLMAALHTGLYKGDRLPNSQLIKGHFEMCRLYGEQYGNLIYVGVDEELREIYALGCKKFFSVIQKAQTNVNRIFGLDEELYHIDAGRVEGFLPRVIGFLLAHGVNARFCEKLFYYWFGHKYRCLAKAVDEEKQRLKEARQKNKER